MPMRFRSLNKRIIAVAAASILTASGAACSGTSGEKTILFEVTGPEAADVTFVIGTDQTQKNGEKLPFKHEATSTSDPLIAVITAQSKGNGDIVCKISIDGKEVKTNKSSGEFAVVTCSNS